MKKWLKRLRGAVGLGLTWAAAWFGMGAIFMSLIAVFGTLDVGIGLPELVSISVAYAILGFVGGAAFSVVLRIAEGRRRFDEMSLPRFAAWGAGGGLLVSMLFLSFGVSSVLQGVLLAGLFTLMGAGSAAGSLALARRADDRELLEHGADVADIGLTEEEKRELLAG